MRRQTELRKQNPQIIDDKSDKLRFIKIKNMCSSENNIKKTGSQVTAQELILAKHISKNSYSEHVMYSYNSIKINNTIKKWARNLMTLHKKRPKSGQ